MNAIEELLDQVIKPSAETVERDWSEVIADSQTRRQYQTGLGSAGVAVAFAALFLLQLVLGDFSSFNVVAAPPAGTAVPGAEEGIFPTSTEVFALSGERPTGEILAAWLFALGSPLLAAWTMWRRTTGVSLLDRAPNADVGVSCAAGAALATIMLLSAVVGAALLFTYDPLAAQTGTSWLVLAMALCAKVAVWVVAAALMTDVRQRPQGRFAWGMLLVFVTAGTVVSSIGSAFEWHRTLAGSAPGRGLIQLLFPGDAVHLGPMGGLSAGRAWVSLVLAVVLIVGGLALARRLLSANSHEWRSFRTEEEADPSVQRFSAGVFLLFGVLILLGFVVNQDVRARRSLHSVSLPSEITEISEVTVSRRITASIFDENALHEIVIQGGDEPITGVTNRQLFGSPEFFNSSQADLEELANIGAHGTSARWEIFRNEPGNRISLRTTEEISFPGLNTTIFMSALLFMTATSRRLRSMFESEILGRRQASWFAVGGAFVIGVRLVASLFRLEAEVGDFASRGDQTLFELYAYGRSVTPQTMTQLSGWFLPYNYAILLPVVGLAMIGLRRLRISKRAQIGIWVAVAVATVAIEVRFGDLLFEYLNWVLD